MRNHWQKDYPIVPELSEAELDDNSSLKKMLHLVGGGKSVIDFGCATGYLARLLRARGCEVTGIEINERAAKMAEQFCERVIVADLDYVTLTELVSNQKFDVAVFGDVLEHLRNPWEILEEVQQILTPEGYVVASIPNVSHGAVRLALLEGKFQYEPLGLLDNTHLRFFTRQTVVELFERSGYIVETIDRTLMPIFSNLWVPKVDHDDFNPVILEKIEQEPDIDTFQFILRAFPLTQEGKYLALESKYERLFDEHEKLQQQIKHMRQEYQKLEKEYQDLHLKAEQFYEQAQQFYEQGQQTWQELDRMRNFVQNRETELKQQVEERKNAVVALESAQLQIFQLQNDVLNARHDQEVERFRVERLSYKLEQTRSRVQRLRSDREQVRVALENTQNEVKAMKTSKFWKLRSRWFKIKQAVRFRGDP